jgi:hypothetical protein
LSSTGLARRALIGSMGPVVTAVLSIAVMVESLRLWEWTPGTPLGLDGDNASVTTWVRTIVELGPYADNPNLGAPFSQNLGWFPTADDVHFLALWLLGRVSDNAFTVTSLYFFIGYPLAALTIYWLARTERLSVAASVVVGVLFAALPGHQTRAGHLFLAAYWVVPLGMWLALRIFRGRPVLRPGVRDGWGARRPALWTLRSALIVVVVALGGIYYVVFTLIVATIALLLRLVTAYRREELYRGLAVIGAVAAVSVSSLLVMQARTRDDGVIVPPLQRSPAESEVFGGKIIDLILPWSQHRISALAEVTQRYDNATQPTYEVSALGLVAAVGGVVAVVAVMTALLDRSSWARRQPDLWGYGVLALVAAAFYTKDGLGAVFALAVSPDIRSWLRLYVVIALFGLLAVGRLLTTLRGRRGPGLGLVACVGVLLLGIFDQTNSAAAPRYEQTRQQLAAVSTLTGALESRYPEGCTVFQLPVIRFPGSAPVGRVNDYDLELPYLASSRLRWSYGAIGGTAAAEWQFRLPGDPAALSDDLAAAGFCAVVVDTWGYEQPETLIATLSRELGPSVATASDGRLVAFHLGRRRADLVARIGSEATDAKGHQVLYPFGVEARAAS